MLPYDHEENLGQDTTKTNAHKNKWGLKISELTYTPVGTNQKDYTFRIKLIIRQYTASQICSSLLKWQTQKKNIINYRIEICSHPLLQIMQCLKV